MATTATVMLLLFSILPVFVMNLDPKVFNAEYTANGQSRNSFDVSLLHEESFTKTILTFERHQRVYNIEMF
ncbi:hypothetical protein ACP275_12G029300 [Erythranthe tilingii]